LRKRRKTKQISSRHSFLTSESALPKKIADAIVFIGSDKASSIIGASLAVDGGMTAD
jgi:NAD(P)-dependent dehydrogenase (short-subunit alcohol dehydrogenase family)